MASNTNPDVEMAQPAGSSSSSSSKINRGEDINEAIADALLKQQKERSANGLKSVCIVLLWLYVVILSTYATVVSTRNMAALGECECGGEEAATDAQLLATVDVCDQISICMATDAQLL